MSDKKKLQVALYWGAACGGCDVAVLDTNEFILTLAEVADIRFWPIAADGKYADVEAMEDGELDLAIFNGAVRNRISNHVLIEAVRSSDREMLLMTGIDGEATGEVQNVVDGRDKIVEEVFQEAKAASEKFGIEIVDVRFKRINYVEEVQQSVYQRMITERQRIAAKYRSEGEGRKLEIEGQKEKEQKQIISEAYKKAEEI